MHVVNATVLGQWAGLTDEQVVRQVLSGQTALFEILMRRYNERLYRAARAILLDEREAEVPDAQRDSPSHSGHRCWTYRTHSISSVGSGRSAALVLPAAK
jgi:hypothetical protein